MNDYPIGVRKPKSTSPSTGPDTTGVEKSIKKITDIPGKITRTGDKLKGVGKFARKVLG